VACAGIVRIVKSRRLRWDGGGRGNLSGNVHLEEDGT
jgi:hypothetical protein